MPAKAGWYCGRMAIIGDNSGGINPLRLPKSLPPGVPAEIQNLPAETFTLSGTGFAAPVAAGTAALMLSANPGLTPGDVKDLMIEASAETGVLDTAKALELATERCPSCIDGANIAGVQPVKGQKKDKAALRAELGLEGPSNPAPFRGLNWRGPAEEPPTTLTPMGFGFKTFD